VPSIHVDKLTKAYNGNTVLKDLNLNVKSRELMVILGPTGCGKSTLLNVIAGLERQDSGNIFFDNEIINDIPPEKRNVGLVFQNFALFPHMTVFENVAYGLKARGKSKSEVGQVVGEKLSLLEIKHLQGKYPGEISGGEQQRVALARALVIEPEVLLLDEPFSNLDARIREQLRIEIREVQKKLGITTIHVTHDHTEAYVMADRIAVMGDNRIEQVGLPDEIFYRPESEYVAKFVGANVFKGAVVSLDSKGEVMKVNSNGLILTALLQEGLRVGDPINIFIRPENVFVILEPSHMSVRNIFKGSISSIVEMRGSAKITITLENSSEITAEVTKEALSELSLKIGKSIYVAFKATAVRAAKTS